MHGVGSRNKLTPSHARLYPGTSTLDVLGRAICAVGCLPRKELHEAWEMATRVHAHFLRQEQRGGRVVDLCAGFGLLAQCLAVLDPSIHAVAVDAWLPANHPKVHAAVASAYPHLQGRVTFVQTKLHTVALHANDILVSAHACGGLTDEVLARAHAAGARVAVLPCCHTTRFRADLVHEPDRAAALDALRCTALRARGYGVWTEAIPAAVSPKNRLIFGLPPGSAADGPGRTPADP